MFHEGKTKSSVADERRKRADWMNPIDDEILETLSVGLVLSPTIIAENIDYSRGEVQRRLNLLVDFDLADKVDRGRYEISEQGVRYLQGELNAGESISKENDR